MSERLLANLAALGRRDPALEARLRLSMASEHVAEREGAWFLRSGRGWIRLSMHPEEVAVAREGLPEAPECLVLGVGRGELVHTELDAGASVLAWDRDPWMLRMLLEQRDLARVLRQGRLRLALGADLLAHLPPPARVVPHPVLSQVYRDERTTLERGDTGRRALVCAGELLVDDLSDALRERGYTPVPWETARQDPAELAHQARACGAELAASINLSHGLVEATRDLGIPLISWEIDPATDTLLPAGPTGHAHLFTWRRSQVAAHRAHGLEHAHWLPLAANPTRRTPTPSADPRHDAPVCFVGASMVDLVAGCTERFVQLLAAWHGSEPAEAKAALDLVLRVQRENESVYLVPAAIDKLHPGFREAALRAGAPDPVHCAGEIAAAEKRLNILAPLGALGLAVWGDEGFRILERHGARYMGRAGHGDELTRIYSTSRIHVDVGRIYQHDIVTMRVFDVLACGGFLIAEASDDLAAVLEPGVEVETWTTRDELVAKVRHYLDHPGEARAIAERGRERVLAEHTIAARVGEMLEAAAPTR